MKKQCRFKMTKDNMQNIFYAILITRTKLTNSFGIGIYEYSKKINSKHHIEIAIEIDEDKIDEFEGLSGQKLTNPIMITINNGE